jgi:hypothetical protein
MGERLYHFGTVFITVWSSRQVILTLWRRLKSVVGAEYARLNTGGSITRGNSGNGALPTLDGKNVGNKKIAPNAALLLEDLQGGEYYLVR